MIPDPSRRGVGQGRLDAEPVLTHHGVYNFTACPLTPFKESLAKEAGQKSFRMDRPLTRGHEQPKACAKKFEWVL